jgi:hypothetical protein
VRLVLYCSRIPRLRPVSVISAGIVVQLRELEIACEPAFAAMARSSWATLKQVSGQSAYTADLVNAVEQVVESVKPLVEQKKYLRNFLDKACRSANHCFRLPLDLDRYP